MIFFPEKFPVKCPLSSAEMSVKFRKNFRKLPRKLHIFLKGESTTFFNRGWIGADIAEEPEDDLTDTESQPDNRDGNHKRNGSSSNIVFNLHPA